MPKSAGPMVHYTVSVAPERHELRVQVRYVGDFAQGDLLVQTPTWVPGNYNFMQFARDIFSVEAVDTVSGEALAVSRDGWQGFRISGGAGDVTVSYRAYAFSPDFGEPSGILDSRYAVLLGTRYLYCAGHIGSCRVSYVLPESWQGSIHHPSGATRIPGETNTWEYRPRLPPPR